MRSPLKQKERPRHVEGKRYLVARAYHLFIDVERSLKTVYVNVIASGSAGRRQSRFTSVADTERDQEVQLLTEPQ